MITPSLALVSYHDVIFGTIKKTCQCNKYPLTPHFYIVKLECTGISFFLFLVQDIDCGYSFERPRLERIPTINVLSQNVKDIKIFPSKFSIFTAGKKSLFIAWVFFHNAFALIISVFEQKDFTPEKCLMI